MKTTDYGFIGVGRMGAHMARRLLKAGISLTVFDTSKEATDDLAKSGAQVASSALEVANNTEIAFLSLPTPDIVQKVCAGLTGAKKMKVVVDCSTTGPGVARIAHAELAQGRHHLYGCARQRRHGRRARRHAGRHGLRQARGLRPHRARASSNSASCSSAAKARGSRRS